MTIDFSDVGNARAMGKAAALFYMADVFDDADFRRAIHILTGECHKLPEDNGQLESFWDGIADGLSAHSDPEAVLRPVDGCGRYWVMLYRQATRRIQD